MKENKKTYMIGALICLIPVMIGLIMLPKLPDQVITHWNAAGEPDGYSSKFVGVVLLPGILFLGSLLVPVILKMDPKYDNMSRKSRELIYWLLPMISVFTSGSTLAHALGKQINVARYACLFMGIMFVVIGNYLPKMTQSYTVGIKIPWTLADEDNWNKTHRMAGWLWTIGGAVILVSSFSGLNFYVFTATVLVMILVPCVYSYLYYRKMHK